MSEVSVTSNIEQQIANLTSLVQQNGSGYQSTVKMCGVCSTVGHSSDMCPSLQENNLEQANALGSFQGQ